jgi:UDP-N-acetylglucosamine 2-epimerase (non-hydrolysing)
MSEIMVVIGTRPEIMKTASVIENLHRKAKLVLVWSGQHYDQNLYRVFFEQFRLPEPDYDMEVGSGSHSFQTGQIMIKLEEIVSRTKPKIVVAEGDTNTVVAVAIASAKLRIPFAHIESGMRSFDMAMPEEVNRLIADRVGQLLFAPTQTALLNLLFEGISPDKVHLSGDTDVDAVLRFAEKLSAKVLVDLSVEKRAYGLVTIHRSENTENRENLRNIMDALKEISRRIPLIFPMHPRTREFMNLHGFSLKEANVRVTPPLGYLEFLSLMKESSFVVTDSGGVQEEALTLGVPCVTARNNTEWAETLDSGGNVLAGTTTEKIVEKATYALEQNEDIRRKLRAQPNPLGDGRAGERICEILLGELGKSNLTASVASIDFRETGYPKHVLLTGRSFVNQSVSQVSKNWEVSVVQAYDGSGEPKSPYPDAVIREGWSIVVWGPSKRIDGIIRYAKDQSQHEKEFHKIARRKNSKNP